MKKLSPYSFLLVVLILIVEACQTVPTMRFSKSDAVFAGKTHYNFLPWDEHNSQMVNDKQKTDLYRIVEQELSKKGYEKDNVDQQLMVNVMLVNDLEGSYQNYQDYYKNIAPKYHPNVGFGTDGKLLSGRQDIKGTLVIDVFDYKTGDLLWEGLGMGLISTDPAKNSNARLSRNIDHILSTLPNS